MLVILKFYFFFLLYSCFVCTLVKYYQNNEFATNYIDNITNFRQKYEKRWR